MIEHHELSVPGKNHPTQAEKDAALAELKRVLRMPRPPVPDRQSLRRDCVRQPAWNNASGGSQAARNFLFWLAGQPDPTGFQGCGGIELRRLDSIG